MTANIKKILGPGVNFGSYIGVFQAEGQHIVDSIQYPSTDIKSIIAGPYNVVNLNSLNFNIISHRTARITSFTSNPGLVGANQNAYTERTKIYIGQNFGYGSYIYTTMERPGVIDGAGGAQYDAVWNFSTGNLVWSRMLWDPNMGGSNRSPYSGGGVPQAFYDGANDFFSYVSAISYSPSVGGTRTRIMKTQADNGAVLWSRTIYHVSTLRGYYNCVTQDSLGNVYACGDTSNSFVPLSIVKFNSSGTVQWRFGLGRTGMENYSFADVIAGPDGLYALVGTRIGWTNTFSPPYLLKIDYNDCSIIWQRKLKSSIPIYGSDGSIFGSNRSKMSLDSSGNLYLAMTTNSAQGPGTGEDSILLYKFSSSGTQLFTSKTIKTNSSYLTDMKVISGFIHILFRGVPFDYTNPKTVRPIANDENSCFMKVPIDGSKTGEYLIQTSTSGSPKFAKVFYTNNNDTTLGFANTSPGVDDISSLSTTSIAVQTDVLQSNPDYPLVRLENTTPSSYSAYKITI